MRARIDYDCSSFCHIEAKSTILEAVRRAFYPQWNLAFHDADFFQCVPANTICIDVILGDIPDEFRDLESYGHHLCGWNPQTLIRHDEPGDGLEDALRIRLAVGNDLEPSWRVIRGDEAEGVSFKPVDRAKVSVSLIGALSDLHLNWSRGSLLSRLTETESISLTLVEAGRAAKAALDTHRAQSLSQFDAVAQSAEKTARSLGVNVATAYKAHLDADSINIRLGSLALHDGEMLSLIFRGLSEFFVGDLMGKARSSGKRTAPRRGGRVLCVHGPALPQGPSVCDKMAPAEGIANWTASSCGRP